jgi:hypothetical protein
MQFTGLKQVERSDQARQLCSGAATGYATVGTSTRPNRHQLR